MREGFNGINADTSPDLFVPFRHISAFLGDSTNDQNHFYIEIVARLRPSITTEQARQEIEPIWQRFREDPFVNPNSEAERQVRLELQSVGVGSSLVREQFRMALLLLLAGTGLLLLMVCANVGGLLIARAAAQEKEIAVRLALGASRTRIIRQWLVESLLLTSAGSIGGALFTYAAIPLLVGWMPPVPGAGAPGELRTLSLRIQPDFRVLGFFIVTCGVAAILSAVVPAWHSSRNDLSMALKAAISEKRHRRVQTVLCALQVALCTVLLISASLTSRTLSNLRAIDPGFDRNHVVSLSSDPGMRHYNSEQAWSLRQRLLEGARSLPGIRAAGIAGIPLMRGIGLVTSIRLPGQKADSGFNTSVNAATPGYFDAMGIHVLSGMDFQDRDADRAPVPIIVNEAFARRFFGIEDVIGRQVGVTKDNLPQYEIVGLVSDAHYRSLREIPPPVFYMPFGVKSAANRFILQVRTSRRPESMIEPIRDLLKSIDPGMPLYQAATLADEIDRSLWQERLTAGLASSFSLFAMLLSAIGLYGMLAYFVIQHRRELGVRLAIGANAADIVRLVLKRTLLTMASGLIVGVFLYTLGARWLRTLLYGVEIFDPTSIVIVVMLLFATTAAATVIPSLRAIRVDPASSLREE